MKIERIDNNSIRCTLTSLDLSSRNLSARDMAYGSQAARQLFDEMMDKAHEELGFDIENMATMIEAIPLKGGAIQLIISKVDHPEELDIRFSKFAQGLLGSGGFLEKLASHILEGAQGYLSQMGEDENILEEIIEEESEETTSDTHPSDSLHIFRFHDLDSVCTAARAISRVYKGVNTLYKDAQNHSYYLVLHAEEGNEEALNRASNLLSEYAERVQGDGLSEAYYQEHYVIIVKDCAVQRLKKF